MHIQHGEFARPDHHSLRIHLDSQFALQPSIPPIRVAHGNAGKGAGSGSRPKLD